MSFLKSAFDDAEKTSRQIIERVKGASPNARTYGGAADPLGLATNRMMQSEEQLQHNKGQVYGIVRLISNRIAGQKVHMAERVHDVTTVERRNRPDVKSAPQCYKNSLSEAQLVTDHPLLETLADPNPIMLTWTLWYLTMSSLELTGTAYWWLRKNEETGKREIWPLPANWVTPKHTDKQFFSGWKVSPGGFGTQYTLEADEIVYFYYPDPADPLGALAPLQAMAPTVFVGEMIEESQRRAFLNGCNPGLALTVGRLPEMGGVENSQRPVLTKDQRDQLIAAVKRVYRGVASNEEPLILDGMITDARKISNTVREMDFQDSGDSVNERLAMGWGVNEMSMGKMGATRAESAVADDHLIANVIKPRLEMLSQALTTWVAPRFAPGQDVIVWIEMPYAVDQDFDLEADTAMYDRGAMNRDEWRARRNLPPVQDGHIAITPYGDVPVVPLEAVSNKSPIRLSRSKTIRQFRAAGRVQVERRIADVARATTAALVELGESIRVRVSTELAQGVPFVESMADHLVTDSEWVPMIRQRIAPQIRAAAMAGAELEWLRHHALSSGKQAPQKPRRLEEKVIQFAQKILAAGSWLIVVDTVRTALKRAIRKAADQLLTTGIMESPEGIVRDAVGERAARTAGFNIARTEAPAAMESGADAVRNFNVERGVKLSKRWRDYGDGVSRPTHKTATGQTVPVGTRFIVGGHACDYPGDPDLPAEERCNCRCTTETVYPPRKATDGLVTRPSDKPIYGRIPQNGGFYQPIQMEAMAKQITSAVVAELVKQRKV